MRKVLLDTNIFIEYFAKRSQYTYVKQIFNAIEDGVVQAVMSAGSFYTIAYVMEMELKRMGIHNPEKLKRNREYLHRVLDLASLATLNDQSCRKAVNDELFNDIEDSLQYRCAIENDCEAIVSINLKDFGGAKAVNVLSPMEFAAKYLQQPPSPPLPHRGDTDQ